MQPVNIGQAFFSGHTQINSVGQLVSALLPNVYLFASILLFLYAAVGGFMIITGAGDADSTENGKSALTNAIIGFVIIFVSYWIIQIVEVITGISIFNSTL